ncbi:hypothetical protein PQO03_13180 [Lentisphaera profundi]|uniref:HEPN domain-containing protein n=1 Tax=Lentisphaera profundi TaxID=1658616 RepID=A0ABY7VZS6_9BACT|nr:hypothetical protein [Lentisphaera profundi]WDE98789.1 hypothetical protein PQO03_13180 [Lentisphaera profundi]
MTYTLPKDLTHCYALLFTGEAEYKDGKHLRAMLCFEECRMLAEQKLSTMKFLTTHYFVLLAKKRKC